MKFIKEIPHQSSKSPRITEDYFDDESLKIMEIGNTNNVDLYYNVVNTIRYGQNEVVLYLNDTMLKNMDRMNTIVESFKASGFKSEIVHKTVSGVGWYKELIVYSNENK